MPKRENRPRATVRDIAEHAGVSVQTVSNFLSQRYRTLPENARRIEEAISALDYRPNAAARSLRAQRAFAIAAVLEDPNHLGIRDPLHTAFLHGAALACQRCGHQLVLSITEPAETRTEALRFVQERRVDGLLLSMGPLDAKRRESIRDIAREGMPLVLLQDQVSVSGVGSVLADDEIGAQLVAEHLAELGHERVAFFGAQPMWPGPSRRRLGFLTRANELGMAMEEWSASAYTVEAGFQEGRSRLRSADRPSAVLAANDLVALGLIQAAGDLQLRVPEDLSVVGFNDFDFTPWLRPPLTTVHLPGEEMGARAVEILVASSSRNAPLESAQFHTSLLIRGTTGKKPQSSPDSAR
jgi:DNA-binding LacI/PurR family transcriptional regulator